MNIKKLNKDKIRRILSYKLEIKLVALSSILKYFNMESPIKQKVYKILYFIDKNFFFSKVNNLCILTGRQSGVYKICKISRIALRDSKHDIFGLRKSSW